MECFSHGNLPDALRVVRNRAEKKLKVDSDYKYILSFKLHISHFNATIICLLLPNSNNAVNDLMMCNKPPVSVYQTRKQAVFLFVRNGE